MKKINSLLESNPGKHRSKRLVFKGNPNDLPKIWVNLKNGQPDVQQNF